MPAASRELRIGTPGEGLHECTADIERTVVELRATLASSATVAAGPADGLCTVFIRHTSASLLIQENADPSARRDLEAWLARLVPPGDRLYTHVAEGPDDMPSHVRSALTATSLGIPIVDGRLGLGTWQGIYLWEHRAAAHERRVIVNVLV